MTDQEIWNCETPIAELLGISVPEWIEQDIAASTIASITQGGCASGAYMPAVTYWTANDVMASYGDDVLDYINDEIGELPTPPAFESWKGRASFYLAYAVELWVGDILGHLGDLEIEDEDETPCPINRRPISTCPDDCDHGQEYKEQEA